MITEQQKNKILQIVNVFETGTIDGEYDQIVVFNDGKKTAAKLPMAAAKPQSREI